MRLDDLIKRADELIALAKQALAKKRSGDYGVYVPSEDFTNVRSAALSFIEMVYDRDHTYYKEFDLKVKDVSDFM